MFCWTGAIKERPEFVSKKHQKKQILDVPKYGTFFPSYSNPASVNSTEVSRVGSPWNVAETFPSCKSPQVVGQQWPLVHLTQKQSWRGVAGLGWQQWQLPFLCPFKLILRAGNPVAHISLCYWSWCLWKSQPTMACPVGIETGTFAAKTQASTTRAKRVL